MCKGFEVLKHILDESTDEATSSNPSPPTPEWFKIDFISGYNLLSETSWEQEQEEQGDLHKTFEYEHKVALVSVHPSLILHSSLSKKDDNLMNKQELKKVRLCPDVSVKMKFAIELIRLSVSLNEKVFIFSQYIQPLKLLNELITHIFAWNVGKEVMMLKGGLHQKDRQMIINEFNDPNSKAKVLLASTKTCSEGIHLVGASCVVLLDVDWNRAIEKQAINRAYRLGQKKVVEKGRLAEMVFSSSSEELKNKNAFELEKHVERSVVWVQAIFRSKEQKKIIRSNTCYSAQANKHRKRVVFQEGDLVWIHLRKEIFSAGRFGSLRHELMVSF
ncbi:SNF2 domain-containing protein CLASSY 3 [Tanacetum coccineum]